MAKYGKSASKNVKSTMHIELRDAHQIYEARSVQHGTAIQDWLAAERQIDDEIDRVRGMPTNADDVRQSGAS